GERRVEVKPPQCMVRLQEEIGIADLFGQAITGDAGSLGLFVLAVEHEYFVESPQSRKDGRRATAARRRQRRLIGMLGTWTGIALGNYVGCTEADLALDQLLRALIGLWKHRQQIERPLIEANCLWKGMQVTGI